MNKIRKFLGLNYWSNWEHLRFSSYGYSVYEVFVSENTNGLKRYKSVELPNVSCSDFKDLKKL